MAMKVENPIKFTHTKRIKEEKKKKKKDKFCQTIGCNINIIHINCIFHIEHIHLSTVR